MDECEQLRQAVLQRKIQQNKRRKAAGKPPRHKIAKPRAKPASSPSRAQKPPPAESGTEEDTAMSFDEWKACNWTIKKGERSQLSDMLGVPQFTRLQVRKSNPAWEQYRKRKP